LELLRVFSREGEVDSVSLILADSEADRLRDFGIVVMTRPEDGLRAIKALNGFKIGGQPLEVRLAEPLRRSFRKFNFLGDSKAMDCPSPIESWLGLCAGELDFD
jgi:RNA recognition motif-containing protein